MSDREALAWLAGFVDGDGYFGWSPNSNGGAIGFVISQNGSRELLDRAAEVLGFGKVNGPYQRDGRQPNWRFCVQNREQFQAVGAMLWPWLGSIKREQFARVMKKGF